MIRLAVVKIIINVSYSLINFTSSVRCPDLVKSTSPSSPGKYIILFICERRRNFYAFCQSIIFLWQQYRGLLPWAYAETKRIQRILRKLGTLKYRVFAILSERSFLEKRTKSIVTLYLRKAYITKICGDMNVRTLRVFK